MRIKYQFSFSFLSSSSSSKVAAAMLAAWFGLSAVSPLRGWAEPAPPVEKYTWRNVAIGGGGFITGIVFHPRDGRLMYSRTDVGGAYRWEEAEQRWEPVTDWIGPDDANWTGIESLALDPADTNKLYLAAGTYEGGPATILRSSDRGRSFQRTDVPFRMGGNETGRFNGERLAVDPNLGTILFFGSRAAGLWRSSDGAVTWRRVDGFPETADSQEAEGEGTARVRFGEHPVGIVSVVFDPTSAAKGESTRVLYAAVSTTKTNLFCSRDCGLSWQPVAGQPVGFRPNHLIRAADGVLYLSYGLEPGPNTMTDGSVWRYSPSNGTWADITPERPGDQPFGYGAVAACEQQPATIMVATFNHWKPHDELYLSTDRGTSWQAMWRDDTRWDCSSAPYTQARRPHWIGALAIHPGNPRQALFGTGYGIWASSNLSTEEPALWSFLNAGLEETVPLALVSTSTGASLVSGVGDVDGFRHEDVGVSPELGSFAGPRLSNTEDLACAGRKPEVMVRVGTSRAQSPPAALSLDGGASWTRLACGPTPNSSAGSICIAADGGTIVWTPRRGSAHYSVDCGTNWSPCNGLQPGVRVVADPVNPSGFYAYDPGTGRFYASTNGAARFEPASTSTVAGTPPPGRDSWREGSKLYAAPDREGDLWLALRERGLFHSDDGGVHFTRLGGIERAASLGFGKPPHEGAYAALFLAGRVHSTTGLYRSDDTGKSWIRINDDAHQFGWIDHVTGDPKIFGRVYFGTGGRGVIWGEPAP